MVARRCPCPVHSGQPSQRQNKGPKRPGVGPIPAALTRPIPNPLDTRHRRRSWRDTPWIRPNVRVRSRRLFGAELVDDMSKVVTRARAKLPPRALVDVNAIDAGEHRPPAFRVHLFVLGYVAVCSTTSTPRTHLRTTSRSVIDPTVWVNADVLMSSPIASSPSSGKVRIRASPRWPALPVTSTFVRVLPCTASGPLVTSRVSPRSRGPTRRDRISGPKRPGTRPNSNDVG